MTQELFDRVVQKMQLAHDKSGSALRMASLIVSDPEGSYSHYFRDPIGVDIRSIAKPIVALAIGRAIADGLYFGGVKVELTTPIWQFLSTYCNLEHTENEKQWQKVTLLDCLRITLGHDKGLVFSADLRGRDVNTLVDYVVNYPITREVGEDFVYSNAGTFLVSTLVTECLGVSLDELVARCIFAPLGISEFRWKKYGKYCAGCTGLVLQNTDLHKIARLLFDGGMFEGRQVVPRDWVDAMKRPQVAAPTHRYIADRAFPKWSYGLNLWICEDGNYYCDGTDAQYLICIPGRGVVITALGFQPDTEPVSQCLGEWK
jgi:CubicO group peptidase (beta-lactamase class C family)